MSWRIILKGNMRSVEIHGRDGRSVALMIKYLMDFEVIKPQHIYVDEHERPIEELNVPEGND